MRIWLIDQSNERPSDLESRLRALEGRPGSALRVQGVAAAQPGLAAAARQAPAEPVDLIVVDDRPAVPAEAVQDLLALGAAVVLVTTSDRAERFGPVAESHSLHFANLSADADALLLELRGALAAHRRWGQLHDQVDRLEQRLNDRIIIERAKGILIQCLGISEEEAYQRLRVLARQQQRRMRDVAQTLLNTRSLFLPKLGGVPNGDHTAGPAEGHDPFAGMIPKTVVAACRERNGVAVGANSDYSHE
jgi:response regulator NasT